MAHALTGLGLLPTLLLLADIAGRIPLCFPALAAQSLVTLALNPVYLQLADGAHLPDVRPEVTAADETEVWDFHALPIGRAPGEL